MAKLRLDKFLADQGLASRTQLRDMIRVGRVSVNGIPVRKPEEKIDTETDLVTMDGARVGSELLHTLMMDKPVGVVCATEDKSEKTVLDLLPAEYRRMGLSPVGRLDKDTSGLLLLSNDGEFLHRVISPKSAVEKCYCASIEGEPTEEDVKAFREGLVLRDGTECLPAKLELLGEGKCLVYVTEGKYHQVRRMLASRGFPVIALKRLSIGALKLDESLAPGAWKELNREDLCRVFRGTNMGNLSKEQL